MAQSAFKKLQNQVARQYEKKGKSPAQAQKIGGRVAYTVGAKKYGKKGMAKKSVAGRK